jgi:hypothetical protein
MEGLPQFTEGVQIIPIDHVEEFLRHIFPERFSTSWSVAN